MGGVQFFSIIIYRPIGVSSWHECMVLRVATRNLRQNLWVLFHPPQVNRKDKTQYLGKINLIDLAGSENVNKSGVQGAFASSMWLVPVEKHAA